MTSVINKASASQTVEQIKIANEMALAKKINNTKRVMNKANSTARAFLETAQAYFFNYIKDGCDYDRQLSELYVNRVLSINMASI